MPVFRIQKTEDYTVMSNYHLRDKTLSLKAKGLLSQMLSLPDDWDYTLAGLSKINKESKDAIRSAIKELEAGGYVIRHQTTDAGGRFSDNEYIIHERPVSPSLEKPLSDFPTTEIPMTENPTQLNKDIQNTYLSNKDSFLPSVSESNETNRTAERSVEEFTLYQELIMERIEYSHLIDEYPADQDLLDEMVGILTETLCATKKSVRVAGNVFPLGVVKSRLLKLNKDHIDFVLTGMKENTTKVRNMKQYLLTSLFNAPVTISNHFSSLVNHDMNT